LTYRLLHQVPDGIALDFNAEGFGFETAPPALGANFFAGLPYCAQTFTAPAGSQLAVEGEEARIKALNSNAAGRADSFLAENFFSATFFQNYQVSCSLVQRCPH
jgi:hypothetical protein